MRRIVEIHPGVLAYDRVHRSYVRSAYTGNFNWWSNYLEIRTTQIAALYQLTGAELINLWVEWRNDLDQSENRQSK